MTLRVFVVEIVVFVNVMGDTINPPYFERQLYQLSVAEGSPYGHTIGYVNATNPEAGNIVLLHLATRLATSMQPIQKQVTLFCCV